MKNTNISQFNLKMLKTEETKKINGTGVYKFSGR